MEKSRLTNQLFDYFWNKKTTTSWIKETRKNLERSTILEARMLDRDAFRNSIHNLEGFQDERRAIKTGRAWTGEQRQQHSEFMKKYWRQRKLLTKLK